MKLIKAIAYIILLSSSLVVNAQIFDNIDVKKYHRMVKQYDEFIKRFNCEEKYMDNFIEKLALDFDWSSNRPVVIASLVNTDSVEYNKEILAFADYIDNNSIYLNKYDSCFSTYAYAKFKYKNKDTVSVNMRMKLVGNDINGWSWRIKDVESPIFYYGNMEKEDVYISVKDNEINFLDFHSIFGYSYKTFTDTLFVPDNISTFLYLTANKELEFLFVDKITYHYSLVDYLITINEVLNSTPERSGYLITSIIDNTGKELVY